MYNVMRYTIIQTLRPTGVKSLRSTGDPIPSKELNPVRAGTFPCIVWGALVTDAMIKKSWYIYLIDTLSHIYTIGCRDAVPDRDNVSEMSDTGVTDTPLSRYDLSSRYEDTNIQSSEVTRLLGTEFGESVDSSGIRAREADQSLVRDPTPFSRHVQEDTPDVDSVQNHINMDELIDEGIEGEGALTNVSDLGELAQGDSLRSSSKRTADDSEVPSSKKLIYAKKTGKDNSFNAIHSKKTKKEKKTMEREEKSSLGQPNSTDHGVRARKSKDKPKLSNVKFSLSDIGVDSGKKKRTAAAGGTTEDENDINLANIKSNSEVGRLVKDLQ